MERELCGRVTWSPLNQSSRSRRSHCGLPPLGPVYVTISRTIRPQTQRFLQLHPTTLLSVREIIRTT